MTRIKLVGATGYGGLGLIELCLAHPEFNIVCAVATQDTGKPLAAVWPYLQGYTDLIINAPDSAAARDCDAEITVFATPDRVGQAAAAAELAAGRQVLDYSGDFRFNNLADYGEYARRLGKDPEHLAAALLPQAVYGLPEFYREKIAGAKLVGNPGCFAMSCLLGLLPAWQHKLLLPENIICDCKSGISGAGKKAASAFHYPERYDNMNAYRLSGHQHVMEVERQLALLGGGEVALTFTPQVVPQCRGIMSCLYGKLAPGVSGAQVLQAYQDAYAAAPFVLVAGAASAACTADVRGANRCLLTVACDERAGTFRVISHIDNLLKGQAGNVLQCLNLMCALPETMGLERPGAHP